jgi:hypothetical protein
MVRRYTAGRYHNDYALPIVRRMEADCPIMFSYNSRKSMVVNGVGSLFNLMGRIVGPAICFDSEPTGRKSLAG